MAISGRIHRGMALDPRVQDRVPYEMHTNALLFVQDAGFLGNRHTAGQIFLLFHGIELALKAFLSFKGISERDLWNRFGHHLEDLLLRFRGTTHITRPYRSYKSRYERRVLG